MKLVKLSILCFCLLLMIGCYKDKGNYDYKEINKISLVDFDTYYELTILDTLKVKPTVEFALNNDNISYCWLHGKDEVICEEKDINCTVLSL